MKSLKMMEKVKKKRFKVIFEKYEGKIRCVCSMFVFKGILCKLIIVMLSRNRIKLLSKKYIIEDGGKLYRDATVE